MTTTTVQFPPARAAPRSASQWQVALEQFKKNRLAILGLMVLGALYVMALFAPFLAPYGLSEYSTSSITRYMPPTRVYFQNPQTGALTAPFVYAYKRETNLETFQTQYVEDRSQTFPIRFFVTRGEPYRLLGVIPSSLHLFGVDEPGRVFLLGTDNYGRDLLTRLFYGAQVSLTIGIVAVFLATLLGVFFGAMAAFYRGWVDNLIMRTTEILAVIPDIFLLIALTALLPQNIHPLVVFYGIVFILGLINWGGLARTVRGQLLTLRESDFVQAAISLGASESRVMWRHMVPSSATFLIIGTSLAIPGFILAESGLSFIGRGVREPYSSWGLMLNDVVQGGFASFTDRPWVLVPGFFIVLTVLCWNFVGDGLRDALDPKKRR
jgi:peptide/nickel transport system permease protein